MANLFFDSISQKVWDFSFIHILDTASTDGYETLTPKLDKILYMRFRLQLVTQNTHSQLIVLETYCSTTLVATSDIAKLLLRVDVPTY